jgi:hypothetical protein
MVKPSMPKFAIDLLKQYVRTGAPDATTERANKSRKRKA